MREKPGLVLLYGHGVDASIGEGVYADLSSGGSVLRPDFWRLTNHVTGGSQEFGEAGFPVAFSPVFA